MEVFDAWDSAAGNVGPRRACEHPFTRGWTGHMKEIASLFRRAARAWRRRPLREFSRLVVHNLRLLVTGGYATANEAFDRSFDRLYRVDTAGTEEPEYVTAEAALKRHAVRYEPTNQGHLRVLMGMLPDIGHGAFDFVDLGSGKGRALFVAAEFPFRRCVGVEFAQELHDAAVRNISTYTNPARKCPEIRSVHADATTFEFPIFPLVCFANNPFDEQLIAMVAQRIDESVRSVPRPAFFIYWNANYPRSIDALGWTRLASGSMGRASWVIWRCIARANSH